MAPGTVLGELSAESAAMTGLPVGLPVVAGATDGVAAAVAAGIRQPGDYNTTLGTTLVFKGISARPTIDPQGLIYCTSCQAIAGCPAQRATVGQVGFVRGFPKSRRASWIAWPATTCRRDLLPIRWWARRALPVPFVGSGAILSARADQ